MSDDMDLDLEPQDEEVSAEPTEEEVVEEEVAPPEPFTLPSDFDPATSAIPGNLNVDQFVVAEEDDEEEPLA